MKLGTLDFPKTTILDTPQADAFFDRLRQAGTVVLTTHEGPDGDGIGAELALTRALRRMGKRVTVINPGDTLKRFRFLDRDDDLHALRPEHTRAIRDADLALLVDTGELGRAGAVGDLLATRQGPVAAIDHHAPSAQHIDGILAPDFSSTGELMAHVLARLGAVMTPDIAEPLYAAILFDTNQFRFCRNDAEVFHVAAHLVAAGANAETIGKRMFGTVTRDVMLMQSRLMNVATFEQDGHLAWAVVDQEMLAGLRLDRDEVRGMVNVLGDIEGVDIAVLFKKFSDDAVKVSMRSRGNVELHDVAQALGGGGHPFAAGADVRQPLAEVTKRTLDLLRAKMAK